jgi:hypothetical protein
MLRFAFAGTLAVLTLTGARPARAEGDKDVKAVIAKAIEARGGAAAIAKDKASTAKVKGKLHQPFEGDMTATVQSQLPDKMRMDMKIKVMGMDVAFVQVVNGDKGWLVANGQTIDMPKSMLTEARDKFYADHVTDLRNVTDKDIKLSSLGESKVGDKAVVGVRVSSAGHPDINLYFDKGTSLLLKTEVKGKDSMSGAEYTEETFFHDYKKVNGLMVAHKVDIKRDGKPFAETEATEITAEEKFPDKTFGKP